MQAAFQVVRNKLDKSINLLPPSPYKGVLIWLHGLGDTPEGFSDMFQNQPSPVYHGVKVKLIHAPIRKVTANGGMKMTSWYDIKQFGNWISKEQDIYCIQQVNDSLKAIDCYIEEELKQLKTFYKEQATEVINKRIFIGGFSQGCALSMVYGLTASKILGGIIGLSGHPISLLPLVNLGKIPMYIFHGKQDMLIPMEPILKKYKELKFDTFNNIKIQIRPNLGHSVDQYQFNKATQWINQLIGKSQKSSKL